MQTVLGRYWSFATSLHCHPAWICLQALRQEATGIWCWSLTLCWGWWGSTSTCPSFCKRLTLPPTIGQLIPVDALWRPEWHNCLAAAFDAINEPETETNIQRAHVITWYLNGQYEPQSQFSRTVRLSSNQADWERTITIAAWTDHVDRRFPFYLHYVDPKPTSTLGQTYAGHILIVQLPLTNYAAILLTALPLDGEPADQPRQVAVYTLNRLSASSASALVPFSSDLTHYTTRVRRGSLVFPSTILLERLVLEMGITSLLSSPLWEWQLRMGKTKKTLAFCKHPAPVTPLLKSDFELCPPSWQMTLVGVPVTRSMGRMTTDFCKRSELWNSHA